MLSCTATWEELRCQRRRMLTLGASVQGSRRAEDRLTIEFAPELDKRLLHETLAVERECCPFFRFDLDEAAGRLVRTVDHPEQRSSLDALAYAFGVERAG